MRFLITGKNGMLASAFRFNLYFKDSISFSHSKLDISNYEDLAKVVDKYNPEFIINCAAYTDVTTAEKDFTDAEKTNRIGTRILAKVAKERNIFLIHFSTDYVFDGNSKEEYFENDERQAVNKYGLSKKLGEDELFEINPNFLNLRVSWLYGKNGRNFVSAISKFLKEKVELSIVADQLGKTTYTEDVVKATIWLIENKKIGTYHIANDGVQSRFEFTKEIKRIIEENENINCANLKAISSEEYGDKTPRPSRSVLNTDKIQNEGFKLQHWKEALVDYMKGE